MKAQDLPPSGDCVSNDLELIGAELTGFEPCFECGPNDEFAATLKLTLNNKTGSTRTSFAFWATLLTIDSEGNIVSSEQITGCGGPIEGKTAAVSFEGLVTYVCETTMNITDIYMAWTPASDVGPNQCPLEPSEIAPKCATVDAFSIETPFNVALANSMNVSCYGGTDGQIDIIPSGGEQPYTFLWSMDEDPSFSSTEEDLTGLSAGTYNVYVTDGNDCADELVGIQVGEPDELEATLTGVTDVSCFGGEDGAVDIDVTGGTGDYTFAWSNEATTEDLSDLGAGTYSVTITDENDCTFTLDNISVTEPDELEAEVAGHTNVSCFGGNDGALDISVSGGTGNYIFAWSNGAATEDLVDIETGVYSVTITDENDCTFTLDNISVTEPDELEAEVAGHTNVSCFGGDDGALDISVSGGTGDYIFAWSTGAISEDLVDIEAGVYSVTITDENDCTLILEAITVTEPDELEAQVRSVTDASCSGSENGGIDISVTGGTGDYAFVWSTGATSEDLSDIGAGFYSVTITDDNGCEVSLNNIEVEDPSTLEAVVSGITDVSCFGGGDGAVNISVSGGTEPYSIAWSNGATTEDLADVEAGVYSVTITDDNNCTFTLTDIGIDEPEELEAEVTGHTNVSCFGGDDGALDISVRGGTGDYTFAWSNGATTEDLANVEAGVYSVTITDKNDCTFTLENITVTEPDELEAQVNSVTDASCSGSENGGIDVSVTGGTGDYTFAWSNGATTEDLADVEAGSYSVTITDGTNCTFTLTDIEVDEPDNLMVDVSVIDVSCNGDSDGRITLNVSGGTAPYTSDWGDANENGVITLDELSAGEYSVVVSDANGCGLAIDEIPINEPGKLSTPVVDVSQPNCETMYGSVIITSSTEGLSFELVQIDGDAVIIINDFTELDPGYYELMTWDESGCYADSVEFVINDLLEVPETPGISAPSLDCFATSGSFIVTSETEGLEFRLDEGSWVSYPDGGFVDVAPGEHILRVRDEISGCVSGPLDFTIPEPLASPVDPELIAVQPTCESVTGTIQVSSATSDLRFAIILISELNGDIPDDQYVSYPDHGFTGLAPGDYAVFAKSNDGCISGQANISLMEPECVEECETIFAYNEDVSTCFSDYGHSRWGWTNLIEENSGTATMDLYSGAGQCDIDKGTFTGTASITYEGGEVTVEYNMLENYVLNEAHVYIGCDPTPSMRNGKTTVAPGQYPFNPSVSGGVQNYTVGPMPASGDVFVIIHGVACTGNSTGTNNGGQAFVGATSIQCDNDVADGGNGNNGNGNNGKADTKPGQNKSMEVADFEAYPIPFRETINIKYHFDYTSDVTIEFFDMRGRLLETRFDSGVTEGSVTTIAVDFAIKANQMYIVKLSTEREVLVKQIVSSKK